MRSSNELVAGWDLLYLQWEDVLQGEVPLQAQEPSGRISGTRNIGVFHRKSVNLKQAHKCEKQGERGRCDFIFGLEVYLKVLSRVHTPTMLPSPSNAWKSLAQTSYVNFVSRITSHLHRGFEPNSEERKSEWRHEDKGREECNLFGLCCFEILLKGGSRDQLLGSLSAPPSTKILLAGTAY
jgi:hypothetical protein